MSASPTKVKVPSFGCAAELKRRGHADWDAESVRDTLAKEKEKRGRMLREEVEKRKRMKMRE